MTRNKSNRQLAAAAALATSEVSRRKRIESLAQVFVTLWAPSRTVMKAFGTYFFYHAGGGDAI
jgi:hypothetical protein